MYFLCRFQIHHVFINSKSPKTKEQAILLLFDGFQALYNVHCHEQLFYFLLQTQNSQINSRKPFLSFFRRLLFLKVLKDSNHHDNTYAEKMTLSSSVKCDSRKTRANCILVSQIVHRVHRGL